jgi:hypothetical protein
MRALGFLFKKNRAEAMAIEPTHAGNDEGDTANGNNSNWLKLLG